MVGGSVGGGGKGAVGVGYVRSLSPEHNRWHPSAGGHTTPTQPPDALTQKRLVQRSKPAAPTPIIHITPYLSPPPIPPLLPSLSGIAGLSHGTITSSAFRTYHTPLNSQPDFINALAAARRFAETASNELGLQVGLKVDSQSRNASCQQMCFDSEGPVTAYLCALLG